MPRLATAAKRLVLGLPFRSDELSDTLLRKRIALPVFASDAMSSVAYAPQEIFLVLSIAGVSAYALSPWVAVAVAVVMVVVVASYRQNVHAYPSGGGDYEVAKVNLGPNAGTTVASALLVDYVLTVAVSISAASHYASSAMSFAVSSGIAKPSFRATYSSTVCICARKLRLAHVARRYASRRLGSSTQGTATHAR